METKIKTMKTPEETKYISVKPKGLDYFIWFETSKTFASLGCFVGKNGWGKNGSKINLKCYEKDIEAYIYSDELQY